MVDGCAHPTADDSIYPDPPAFDIDSGRTPGALARVRSATFHPSQGSTPRLRTPSARQRFWRRAKWSPDGSHLLAQTDSHDLDLFRIEASTSQGGARQLHHVLRVSAPSTLLDWAWYPFATFSEPATWCFCFSARDVPIRLVDAYSGSTRAVYGIENHVERFEGPGALAFSSDGSTLFAGHASKLSACDLTLPGTNTCQTISLIPFKAADGDELQRGVISALAVIPQPSSSNDSINELVVIGTFAGTVGVYQREPNSIPGSWSASGRTPSSGQDLCLAGWREKGGQAISQLASHPSAPHLLFVSLRSRPGVKCYDLRYLGAVPRFSEPAPSAALLATLSTSASAAAAAEFSSSDGGVAAAKAEAEKTMQRFYFDVDWAGRWLVKGDASGRVQIWKIDNLEDDTGDHDHHHHRGRSLESQATWPLQGDGIGSAALHPTRPLLLTVSGSRHFDLTSTTSEAMSSSSNSDSDSDSTSDSDSDIDTDSSSESDAAPTPVSRQTGTTTTTWRTRDAALTVWDLGGSSRNESVDEAST